MPASKKRSLISVYDRLCVCPIQPMPITPMPMLVIQVSLCWQSRAGLGQAQGERFVAERMSGCTSGSSRRRILAHDVVELVLQRV